MHWKVFVGASEDGNKMFFERSDGTFCFVALVDEHWHKLRLDVLLAEEFFLKALEHSLSSTCNAGLMPDFLS